MDYLCTPLAFQARKTLRYVRLYGPARTAVKVRGQVHMRAGDRPRRAVGPGRDPGAHVGIIGCGNFAFTTLAYFLAKEHGAVVRGAMDIVPERAASLARRYGAAYATDDAERLLADDAIDLVFIASNHASHADYAMRAMRAGKDVHIEKPHVVSEAELDALAETMQSTGRKVRLGFNRPASALGAQALAELGREDGPLMLDWFVVGHELPADHWYNDPGEGGRVLGNLCHWTDFALRAVPDGRRFPIEVRPAFDAPGDDDTLAVVLAFGDGSVATIAFCGAKTHAYEGVRERLSAHRGDALVALTDFSDLRVERGPARAHRRLLFRDHGHRRTVLDSYAMSARGGGGAGAPVAEIRETARLFLATQAAFETGQPTVVEA